MKDEINIFGDIGYEVTLQDVSDKLDDLGDAKPITVNINSYGGSVFEGIAIMELLKASKAEINVRLYAITASIATIISLAGDTIYMAETGLYMIHNPSGLAFGTSDDIAKVGATLDQIKSILVSLYQARTGLSSDEIEEMMDNDTWLTQEEALEKNFINGSFQDGDAEMSLPASVFKNQLNLKNHTIKNNKLEKPTINNNNKEGASTMADTTKEDFQKMMNTLGDIATKNAKVDDEALSNKVKASIEALQIEDKIKHMKNEIRSEISAELATVKAPIDSTTTEIPPLMKAGLDGKGVVCNYNEYQNAITTTKGTAGAVAVGFGLGIDIAQVNIIGRQLATTFDAPNGSYEIPIVTGGTWVTTEPAESASGGGLSSVSGTTDPHFYRASASSSSLNDLGSLDKLMVEGLFTSLAVTEASEGVKALKTASGLGGALTTGSATGLPTPSTVLDLIADMASSLKSVYTYNSHLLVSRQIWGLLTKSKTNVLNFDPTTKMMEIFGTPVFMLDALEASGTGGNLVAVYGQFKTGLCFVTTGSPIVARYDQTKPGHMTYWGSSRHIYEILDKKALVTLKIGS